VGKLNFFRWAIEKGVLTYLSLNSTSIEAEMNKAMKEQSKTRNTTVSSQTSTESSDSLQSALSLQSSKTSVSSTSSTRSTRRRNPEKELAAAKLMQKHNVEIELRFD
jgi:hypothetical protein